MSSRIVSIHYTVHVKSFEYHSWKPLEKFAVKQLYQVYHSIVNTKLADKNPSIILQQRLPGHIINTKNPNQQYHLVAGFNEMGILVQTWKVSMDDIAELKLHSNCEPPYHWSDISFSMPSSVTTLRTCWSPNWITLEVIYMLTWDAWFRSSNERQVLYYYQRLFLVRISFSLCELEYSSDHDREWQREQIRATKSDSVTSNIAERACLGEHARGHFEHEALRRADSTLGQSAFRRTCQSLSLKPCDIPYLRQSMYNCQWEYF